jgi:hypothetical protein
MQFLMTILAVTGGMAFSLTIAVLAEEVIFGQVLRLFSARKVASTEMK